MDTVIFGGVIIAVKSGRVAHLSARAQAPLPVLDSNILTDQLLAAPWVRRLQTEVHEPCLPAAIAIASSPREILQGARSVHEVCRRREGDAQLGMRAAAVPLPGAL